MTYLRLSFAFAVFIFYSVTATSQLTPADSTHLSILVRELSLTEIQTQRADSLLQASASSILSLDKEISKISRSDIPQTEKEKLQADLREKKKVTKETRDLNIQLMLNADQRKIYDERIKPSKPSVLHMGMNHDRANCTICVTK